MARLQEEVVAAQMQQHGAGINSCPRCGIAFRTKGYYRSILAQTFSTLFTNKSPITPELRDLTAKMAALLAFGKVADFLGELLPSSVVATAGTVRNRMMKVGRRLQKSAEALVAASPKKAGTELVVGFDDATRFAFVRNGGVEAAADAARFAFRQLTGDSPTGLTARGVRAGLVPYFDAVYESPAGRQRDNGTN